MLKTKINVTLYGAGELHDGGFDRLYWVDGRWTINKPSEPAPVLVFDEMPQPLENARVPQWPSRFDPELFVGWTVRASDEIVRFARNGCVVIVCCDNEKTHRVLTSPYGVTLMTLVAQTNSQVMAQVCADRAARDLGGWKKQEAPNA